MNNKVIIAVVICLVLALGGGYYVYSTARVRLANITPTPTVEATPLDSDLPTFTPTPTQIIATTNEIVIKWDQDSEKMTFHNSKGYVFTSYMENGVTDKVVASYNGKDILQFGINWLGYTEGNLPVMKLVSVKNKYLGNLYRESEGRTAIGGYFMENKVMVTGMCEESGGPVKAPCATTDQINGPKSVFYYLVNCIGTQNTKQCDEIMSGLEIN